MFEYLPKTRVNLLGVIFIFSLFCLSAMAQDSYRSQLQRWRSQTETEIKSDDGWLTVAGLFWLKEGVNIIGSDPSSDIILPPESAPARVGSIDFQNGKPILNVTEGIKATLKNQPVTTIEMKSDESQKPDVTTVGEVTFHIIKRNGRYAVRVRHRNSEARREFTGLKWFPAREEYRLKARFVAYDKPRKILIPSILGYEDEMTSPGYVLFRLAGKEGRLEPVMSGEDKLFFIFRDLTSGKTTYPGGRFLYTELPKDGQVILDFNRAINPPCAFTAFATCPLPPRQNWLDMAIEAGELNYHHEKDGK
jgi:uncharacterized protein (DUF1684 family)